MKDLLDQLLVRKPLLKAKEIARELGVTKNKLNAILHGHPDRYTQDASFRWTLAARGELGVTLPDRWVTAEAFEDVLRGAGVALDGSEQSVRLYVPQGCKLMIDCTARLLALTSQFAHDGKSVTIDFTNAGQTRSYLDRAGFFAHLHKQVVVLPNRPESSTAIRRQGQSDTLVEFGSVDPQSDNGGLIKELTQKFVQQSSNSYQIAAYTVFGELIGNVTEHSKSPLPGFAGLQKYQGSRKHIQTVISDSGLGIASTLRPALQSHYPQLFRQFGEKSLESDMELVVAAMSQGEISRFGRARGLGFKSSREQAVKFHASFSVRQEQFCIRFEYRDGQLVQVNPQTQLSRLRGTHICFDFYVD